MLNVAVILAAMCIFCHICGKCGYLEKCPKKVKASVGNVRIIIDFTVISRKQKQRNSLSKITERLVYN